MSESKTTTPIILDSKKFRNMLTVMKSWGVILWKTRTEDKEKRPVVVLTEDGKILSVEEAVKRYGGNHYYE
jgi:hypothetical protein